MEGSTSGSAPGASPSPEVGIVKIVETREKCMVVWKVYVYVYIHISILYDICSDTALCVFSNVQLILTRKKKFTAILGWLQRSHWMFTQKYVSTIPKLTDIFQLDSSRKQVGMWKYPP